MLLSFKHLQSPYLLGKISVQWIWHQAEIMLANKLLSIRNCNDVWVVVEMNGSKWNNLHFRRILIQPSSISTFMPQYI